MQFHALPEELIRFVDKWTKEVNFHIVKLILFPEFPELTATELENNGNFESSIKSLEGVFRICLGLQPPILSVSSPYDFIVNNPDYLSIDVGKLSSDGLKESSMSGETNDLSLLRIWKKFARDLSKESSTGLWVVNPVSGDRGFYKNSRYTKGASELALKGVKLLPIAGWCYYELDQSAHRAQRTLSKFQEAFDEMKQRGD
jgi:hypothetical protein